MQNKINEALQEEAEAFDKRIEIRSHHGFVPDYRKAVPCDYFYKSFWRRPQFIKLYIGEILKTIYSLFENRVQSGARILDVGCGHGMMSLELARAGYDVMAIDIAEKNIKLARKTLSENDKDEHFGSLKYLKSSFEDYQSEEKFDVIFFSGSLHHMIDLNTSVNKASQLLCENGFLYCHEPIHQGFGKSDSAQVAFIRTLLSLTGHWHDDELGVDCISEASFDAYVQDIQDEFVYERDKHEVDGQSPNDLETDGAEILEQLERYFHQIAYKPSSAYMYRMLGGLRGDDKQVQQMADFLAMYDRYMTSNGFMSPNYFHYLGQKR